MQGFKLTVAKLPVTLVISSVGFEDKELVTDALVIDKELPCRPHWGRK
jgi:hypothetical protein